VRRTWLVTLAVVTAAACGPSAGGDTGGSTQGPTDGGSTQAASAGGPTTSSTSSTSSTSAADTTGSLDGTSDDTAGSCTPEPPTEVPTPPPGCEHYYLHDAAGQPDPTRPSGLWRCSEPPDESVYRVVPVACACEHFHPPCRTGDVDACGDRGVCGPGESCIDYYGSGSCHCLAQCNADAECPAGQACSCASGIPIAGGQLLLEGRNHCLPADCSADDDCGSPLRCRVSFHPCGVPESLHCTTPTDDCSEDGDCPDGYCRFDEVEARWTCDTAIPCE
jgi:hypothetical protein